MLAFRKKPVVIEAMQWDGTAEGATPIIDWVLGQGSTATYQCTNPGRCGATGGDSPHAIAITTLEGTMQASINDWIIRGVQGEFYPCKPDIFAATYEPVLAPTVSTLTVHIAGPDIQIGPRLRQRCAWCGTVLIDYDLGRIAVPEGQDPRPATWPVGDLVAVDGGLSYVVPHEDGEQLPAEACAGLDDPATA